MEEQAPENIVKKVCRELNITQKELAEMMGVNEGTTRQWSSKGECPEWAVKFIETLTENRKNKEMLQTVKNFFSLQNIF